MGEATAGYLASNTSLLASLCAALRAMLNPLIYAKLYIHMFTTQQIRTIVRVSRARGLISGARCNSGLSGLTDKTFRNELSCSARVRKKTAQP
jgi:hypothetical protein